MEIGCLLLITIQKVNVFGIHIIEFGCFFNGRYTINYDDFQEVMKSILEEHLNLKGVTPSDLASTLTLMYWKNI